jgi:hypothetical protein
MIELRREMVMLRRGAQVDALGLVGQLLDIMTAGSKPAPPPQPRDSWDIAFERATGGGDYGSWRVV